MTRDFVAPITFLVGLLLGAVIATAGLSSSLDLFGPQKKAGIAGARSATQPPTIAEQSSAGTVVLARVKDAELADALTSMDLPAGDRERITRDVGAGRSKLLWLTLWDWDGDLITDRITIVSGEYQRTLELPTSRKKVAILSPPSSFIEITGDVHNVGFEGWTTLGLLSGARPIALSRMVPGKAARIEVDVTE